MVLQIIPGTKTSHLDELGTIPDRTKALEEKVRELEDKLNGKWPADVCKFCGERAMRLYHSYPSLGEKGYMREEMRKVREARAPIFQTSDTLICIGGAG